MATNFVALNGETPVQIETFEYEEDVWILQANFKLASGKSLRLDFYDFSDLHEVCVGGEPAAFLPLPILEFVHTEQPMEAGLRHSDGIICIVISWEEKTVNIHGLMPWSCEPAGNRVYSRLLGARNDQDDGGKPGMLFG